MAKIPFALYDAFSETAFGGSQAGIILDATDLDAALMQQIAKEIGAPATSFVFAIDGYTVDACFYSTVMELPMCGHGTIGLMSHLVESRIFDLPANQKTNITLKLPKTTAKVEMTRRIDGRPQIMLDIQPPTFRQDDLDKSELARLLFLNPDDYSDEWPLETTVGDFTHLVVPVKTLAAMNRIDPDYAGLTRFCIDNGIETVATFSTQTTRPDSTIHVRDFCPAVGVAESAAAGTTNAALSSYLIRHGLVTSGGHGKIFINAEQGLEINRPSSILSVAYMNGDTIEHLQVGGIATKVFEGQLHLPPRP